MVSLLAGVDEAGRGPVIGPLVVAGVVFKESTIPKLQSLGVKDSKLLSPNERKTLEKEILNLASDSRIRYFYPSEIDEYVLHGRKLMKLNWLEAKAMASIITELHPDVAYVDASDINASRFGSQIHELVPYPVQVISSHHADRDIAVVSAASILAKVNRDRAVEKLWETYGNFGSGYPSDPRTRSFLCSLADTGAYPDCVRKSWKTLNRIKRTDENSKLG